MLKSLFDYAAQNNIILPPGYVNKPIKAYISLGADGSFLGFTMVDGTENVPCPSIGSLANGTDKCNILTEKRSIVLPDAPNLKSDFFRKALEDGGHAEPALALCVKALNDPEVMAAIKREADACKLKPSDRLSFMVDGVSILRAPAVRDWWQEYRRQFLGDADREKALCLITGEPTVPMRTAPPISGLQVVGGRGSGDMLICFDKAAFCSYGLKQAANAPVSEEAYAGVKAALELLLADAPILAGMKFVHWYDRPVNRQSDIAIKLFASAAEEKDDEEEDSPESDRTDTAAPISARRAADRLVESVKSGDTALPLPDTYYILLVSGAGGRVMIRRWEHGSYAQLRERIARWQSDIELVNLAGTGRVKIYKLNAMLIRLLKRQKSDRRVFERMGAELSGVTPAVISAILNGNALPDAVASRALAYIRSQMTDVDADSSAPPIPDGICCQWLKAWLLRKKKEAFLMPEYNAQNPVPAYHCGASMAVYAAIQKSAMQDVNAGVIQRYYAAASQTPAMVLGRLNVLSNYHLDKINWWKLKELYNELLNAAYCSMGNVIPVTLNLEQQAYFALGYRQMSAEIIRRCNELKKNKSDEGKQECVEEGI